MIFEAFVIPTPRRIRRFFERSINENIINMKINSNEQIKKDEEETDGIKVNIEENESSVKKLGFSVKIF